MKFDAQSGSFVVHVTNKLSGLTSSTLVQVDLDGKNGNDTTLGDERPHLPEWHERGW